MRTKRFFGGVIAVLLAILLAGGIGMAVFMANRGNQSDAVYYGNTRITGDTVVTVKSGQTVLFRVQDSLGRPQNYTYKILPGQDIPEFSFDVDGYKYPYRSETDLTAGVTVYAGRGQVVLTVPDNVQSVLEAVYSGHKVTVPDVDIIGGAYFVVLISTERKQYRIGLKMV